MIALIDTTGETLEVEEETLLKIPYFETILESKNIRGCSLTKLDLEQKIQVKHLQSVVQFVENEGNSVKLINLMFPERVEDKSHLIIATELLQLIGFLGFDLTFEENNETIHQMQGKIVKWVVCHRNNSFQSPDDVQKSCERAVAVVAKLIIQVLSKTLILKDETERTAFNNSVDLIRSPGTGFNQKLVDYISDVNMLIVAVGSDSTK